MRISALPPDTSASKSLTQPSPGQSVTACHWLIADPVEKSIPGTLGSG